MDHKTHCKTKTVKILKGDTGENLGHLGNSDPFLDTTGKPQCM